MNCSEIDGLQRAGRVNLWQQPVCANFRPEIDPFHNPDYFRPLSQAYTGHNTYWTIPSPEPNLPSSFWTTLTAQLATDRLPEAATALAAAIAEWEPQYDRLLFIAILRAGVPIADWLTRLLPGSQAVAMSMFVGLGVDSVALEMLRHHYPHKRLLFVDGWTGRGGVARALAELGLAPLAVLNDPWGWADFSGCDADIFCPTACFTGPTTLGFSRTFYTAEDELFAAYLFPEKYTRPALVQQWQSLCPAAGGRPIRRRDQFYRETTLRLHSNEVCRGLINANPSEIYFAADKATAQARYALLLDLAAWRKVPTRFNIAWLADYQTQVAAYQEN